MKQVGLAHYADALDEMGWEWNGSKDLVLGTEVRRWDARDDSLRSLELGLAKLSITPEEQEITARLCGVCDTCGVRACVCDEYSGDDDDEEEDDSSTSLDD